MRILSCALLALCVGAQPNVQAAAGQSVTVFAAAMVYQTDGRFSKHVRVADEVPRGEGPTIQYPIALTRDAPNAAAARPFLQFLNSPEADRVFEVHGFIALPPSP